VEGQLLKIIKLIYQKNQMQEEHNHMLEGWEHNRIQYLTFLLQQQKQSGEQ
jgi:hypothetical protein